MAIEGQIRQGDVLVDVPIKPTAETFPQPAEQTILAHGSATGHSHEAVGDASLLKLGGDGGVLIQAGEGVTLVHQEHSAIPIAPGLRPVVRQEEWTDADEPIQVVD